MSKKRFWFSVLSVFLVMFVTDWLFHGMWLAPWYEQTSQLWRTQEDMMSKMPSMWLGQAIFAWAFVWIYKQGIARTNVWQQAFRYALAIFLVSKLPEQLGMWATAPYPSELVLRWGFISLVQAMLAAFVMTWVYQPAKAWAAQ